tara:strand:+ start:663 stop:899 length:237 start_codon:yes stop_codon:yes gene_type:complete
MNTYTYWLAKNFHHYHTTNPFSPEYIDDIDLIINDYDDYVPIKDEPLYNPYEFEGDDLYYDEEEDNDDYAIMNEWLLD